MNVTSFRGLNNVGDPLRLNLDWLVQADNVNITDTGALERRAGYTLSMAGTITGAFSTIDFSRTYVIDAGVLKAMTSTTAAVALATLTSTAQMHWCEINNQVFYNNGVDSGIIQPDNEVLPWRSATISAPEFLGADGEVLDTLLQTLPLGATVIQAWMGRIYAAQHEPTEDQTVIWNSQPLGFTQFNLDEDWVIVPGKVTMLAPHKDALLIGTDRAVFAYDGTKIDQLADYGVIPGWAWAKDGDDVLMWTDLGLCRALPFTNLTDKQISVAPGVQAGAAVIETDGQKRLVVALNRGGTAFNQRS